MAVTLGNALSNFNIEYLNALASKSKRKIEKLDQDWQQINNYWDLYFQASAEGLTTIADNAIQGIVDILGGIIDISVLPQVSGGLAPVAGVLSVTPSYQKIQFSRDVGTTSYSLTFNLTSSGVPVGYVLGAKETDGFYITPSLASILDYHIVTL